MAKKLLNKDDWADFLTDKPDEFDWLNKRKFDQFKEYNQPDPLIKIQGKTMLSQGNYFTLSGKPKAGKSAFVSGLISAAISKEICLGWEVNLPINKQNIIHLDTEQGEFEYFQSIQMVKKLSKIDVMPDNFQSFRLRGIKAEQIREAIEYLAMLDNTGIIIIDGLLDTIINFNDIAECRMITDILRDVTEKKNIGIVCIIHQSKSSDYTIGHLGAFADRYSQSVLQVVRDTDNEISSLQSVYLRSAGKIDNINIMYDNNIQTWKYDYHMPENNKSNNEVTDLDIQNFYNYLFQNRKYVIYKNIEDDAMKYLKISKKKVSSIVTKLHEFGLIKKDGNNYYQNIPF